MEEKVEKVEKVNETQKKEDDRVRSWTFILYPDSAPSDWKEQIEDMHILSAVSPLHDADKNADGSIKKPHYHILLTYEGKKSFNQIKKITDSLNCPIPKQVQSAKGLVRYFCHLDNPEKAQYKKSDIIAFSGLDIEDLMRPTSSNRYALIGDMINFIKNHNITEFVDFMVYAQEFHMEDWFPLLCDNCSYVIGQVIKSQRHKYGNGAFDENIE